MKMVIIGIFDRKAQMFISMEPSANINVSLRTLTELVNTEKGGDLAKWPDDYELYELGTFDNQTGIIHHRTDDGGEWDKRLVVNLADLKTHK